MNNFFQKPPDKSEENSSKDGNWKKGLMRVYVGTQALWRPGSR
jgi:hypothetical protein